MTKRLIKILFVISLPIWILVVGLWIYVQTPATPKEPSIVIEKGMNLRQISAKLETQGIIKYRRLFSIYAHLTRKASSLKAGEYLFEKPVSPRDVLNHLVRGLVQVLKVRLIEGWTFHQIAEYLAELSQIKNPNFKEEILRLAEDPVFIRSLGLNVPFLEGYLFPETYYLAQDTTPSDYLRLFVKEFEKNYQEAIKDLKTLPAFSQRQIVTLASLIEKETGAEEERQIIASVFHNRLAKGTLLQSDPTVIYGLKNFKGDLKKTDLKHPHPYNTYVHPGLPPGPICNPGLKSIKAALHPAQTDFLYFVSKRDGTHYFSKTPEEHAQAVKKYQLGETE